MTNIELEHDLNLFWSDNRLFEDPIFYRDCLNGEDYTPFTNYLEYKEKHDFNTNFNSDSSDKNHSDCGGNTKSVYFNIQKENKSFILQEELKSTKIEIKTPSSIKIKLKRLILGKRSNKKSKKFLNENERFKSMTESVNKMKKKLKTAKYKVTSTASKHFKKLMNNSIKPPKIDKNNNKKNQNFTLQKLVQAFEKLNTMREVGGVDILNNLIQLILLKKNDLSSLKSIFDLVRNNKNKIQSKLETNYARSLKNKSHDDSSFKSSNNGKNSDLMSIRDFKNETSNVPKFYVKKNSNQFEKIKEGIERNDSSF